MQIPTGEIPLAAIRKAYLIMRAGTAKMEDDLQKMQPHERKTMEPAVRARREALRNIEKWWATIAEETSL